MARSKVHIVFINEDGSMYTIVDGVKTPIEYSDIEPTTIQYELEDKDKWSAEDLD